MKPSDHRDNGAVHENPGASDAVFAIPEGWAIDDIARQRLVRQLAAAEPRCSGVVAARVDLVSGTSYRVAAERAALTPLSATGPVEGIEVDGAVLVRPGIGVEIYDGLVAVKGGGLLIDRGAVVHDPLRPFGPLGVASVDGRPPFTWRPVVLFLGFDVDPDLADWVRTTVNGLVSECTEGRIAVPEPSRGPHLTRPCTPTQESLSALMPDVVVALDEPAAELGSRWLGDDRSAVVVQVVPDASAALELVPWRIGRARGRLRARIGREIPTAELARLVRRLCAGPQPLPPRDRRRREPVPSRPSSTLAPARTALAPPPRISILSGPISPDQAVRYRAFADHVRAFGGSATTADFTDAAAVAEQVDVLVLRSLASRPPVHDLVRTRTRRDRRTVVDIGREDLHDPPHELELRGDTAALLGLGAIATTPSRNLCDALCARGVRTLLLPTLLTRLRSAELGRRRDGRRARGQKILGWHTGSDTRPASSTWTNRGDMPAIVLDLLDDDPELTIEVVGARRQIARELDGHERVRVHAGDPKPGVIVRWTVQLWTPDELEAELAGDLRPAVEAHYLGVPTVASVENPAVAEGLIPMRLGVVDHAERSAWRMLLAQLLHDEELRTLRSEQVASLAEALYGPASGLTVVNRFVGWVRYGAAS